MPTRRRVPSTSKLNLSTRSGVPLPWYPETWERQGPGEGGSEQSFPVTIVQHTQVTATGITARALNTYCVTGTAPDL